MDGRDDKAGQEPVGFSQWVRDGVGAAWKAVKGFFGSAGRFVSNHFIKFFLVFWLGASAWVFLWVVDLANPCRGTNLVCPGVEWIRPGYLAEDFRNLLWAASLVFGGAGAGAALINALRRTRLMHSEHELKRSGQDAETFSRAVEQLGSKQTAIRLGAIYALEGLMRTAFAERGDKTFGRQIGETLAAFVRDQSAEEARKEAGPQSLTDQKEELPFGHTQSRLSVDREAAVAVLARSWSFDYRPKLDSEGGVDLTNTRLACLRLPDGADLRRVDLSFSDLSEARMHDVQLQGSWLREANMQGVGLRCSNLEAADLYETNLKAAGLQQANLRRARLPGASLERADLDGADMRGAFAVYAELRGASFYNSQLKGVDFESANLSQALLFDDVFGLGRAVGLTLEQLVNARWEQDNPPELPPDFTLPHRGDGKPFDDPSPVDESWIKHVGPSNNRH